MSICTASERKTRHSPFGHCSNCSCGSKLPSRRSTTRSPIHVGILATSSKPWPGRLTTTTWQRSRNSLWSFQVSILTKASIPVTKTICTSSPMCSCSSRTVSMLKLFPLRLASIEDTTKLGLCNVAATTIAKRCFTSVRLLLSLCGGSLQGMKYTSPRPNLSRISSAKVKWPR